MCHNRRVTVEMTSRCESLGSACVPRAVFGVPPNIPIFSWQISHQFCPPSYDWGARPFYRADLSRQSPATAKARQRRTRSPGGASRAALPLGLMIGERDRPGRRAVRLAPPFPSVFCVGSARALACGGWRLANHSPPLQLMSGERDRPGRRAVRPAPPFPSVFCVGSARALACGGWRPANHGPPLQLMSGERDHFIAPTCPAKARRRRKPGEGGPGRRAVRLAPPFPSAYGELMR